MGRRGDEEMRRLKMEFEISNWKESQRDGSNSALGSGAE
jgi:hypothetical protein